MIKLVKEYDWSLCDMNTCLVLCLLKNELKKSTVGESRWKSCKGIRTAKEEQLVREVPLPLGTDLERSSHGINLLNPERWGKDSIHCLTCEKEGTKPSVSGLCVKSYYDKVSLIVCLEKERKKCYTLYIQYFYCEEQLFLYCYLINSTVTSTQMVFESVFCCCYVIANLVCLICRMRYRHIVEENVFIFKYFGNL